MAAGRRVRAALSSILMLFVLLSALAPARTTRAAGVVATVAGSFQKALGCPDNWQPWCDASSMSDPDGDGIYTFQAASLPVGSYEYKVALNRS
ncbi:MAG TPA: hypothetical protein VE268_00145, partial [Herpetosiphonaceae bacterium]|nr:hypothetical protein [Herpetosiphonaceae bacterium]